MNKPILLIDFDGVIHSYVSGWQGEGVVSDPPVEGAFEFLEKAVEEFDVQIYSSRSKHADGIGIMKIWIDYHWCEHKGDMEQFEMPSKEFEQNHILKRLSFPTEKPAAFLTIDDRAICFEGVWPKIEDLKNFKPWYKR